MMINAFAYFIPDHSARVVRSLMSLDQSLRPVYYGLGERANRHDGVVSGSESFAAFRMTNDAYTLRAPEIQYEVMLPKGRDGSLSLTSKHGRQEFRAEELTLRMRAPLQAEPEPCEEAEAQVLKVMRRLLNNVPIRFAFAAEGDERWHRNGFYRQFNVPGGVCPSAVRVGEDYTRYLPGLYWLTAISADLLDDYDIRLIDLPEWLQMSTHSPPGGKTFLLRAYGHSWEWRDNAARIDDLCECLPGCFSIRKIHGKLAAAKTVLEMHDVQHCWR